MKKFAKIFPLFLVLVCVFAVTGHGFGYAASTQGIYGPYDSFEDLYYAYLKAVEENDVALQQELIEIGETSLKAEIEMSKSTLVQPHYDAIDEYWKQFFHNYFSYGYFEVRDNGWCLSLGNKLSYWSNEDKATGWSATYASFHNNSHWDNTSVMEDQFYCHARLVYAALQDEWNLEPWKTSINPITCN